MIFVVVFLVLVEAMRGGGADEEASLGARKSESFSTFNPTEVKGKRSVCFF